MTIISMRPDLPEWAPSLMLTVLIVLSNAVAIAHILVHQAPLVPTILGQWLLFFTTVLFAVVSYFGLREAASPEERSLISVWTGGAYATGGIVALAYAAHQYLTPLADIGLDTILFEMVFTASAIGIGGCLIGIRTVRYERTLARLTQTKQELATKQAVNESIYNALPDVLYIFDAEGNFHDWNERFEAVTGYDTAEIRSMHPTDFVVEEDRARIETAMKRVFDEDASVTVEARFKTKDGETIPYEFTGAKITTPGEEPLGLVGIGRDISNLKQQRRRFEAIFNNTYQLMGLMSPDGTVLEVNETALEFGGLSADDVIGRKLWETFYFQADENARETARQAVDAAQNGDFHREEITIQGAVGTEIIDFSVRPITDGQDNVELLVPEGRVITELKQRERHLDVIHRFLRHNLRNKMTIIRGSSGMLSQRLSETNNEEHAERVNRAAEDLIQLGETANEMSKIATKSGNGQQPVSPRRLLERIRSRTTKQHPSASIRLSVDEDLRVWADWRLENVFEQLIQNAIEHADHDSPTVEVSAKAGEETTRIVIVDDGPGIPQHELVGVTTDEDPTQVRHGTGFGLWLVRSVLDDYGGDIDYELSSGGGSRLIIELRTVNESSDVTCSEP